MHNASVRTPVRSGLSTLNMSGYKSSFYAESISFELIPTMNLSDTPIRAL